MTDYTFLKNITQRINQTQRKPDFQNILSICKRERPSRPTLFEFIINDNFLKVLSGSRTPQPDDTMGWCKFLVKGFYNAGYDYAVIGGWHLNTLVFPSKDVFQKASRSLNTSAIITDRKNFENYTWPDPETGDYSPLDKISTELPEGMKLIVSGYDGVLERVINIVGFENLCFMLYEDEELVKNIFDAVGSRILKYYELCVEYDSVGALIANDDWGFKTQTLISPENLSQYVFPWYKKIVQICHNAGKPVILHSCGNLEKVMDDVINILKFDGKHSFEDTILPVEKVYDMWGDKIGVFGGIDINFLTKSTLRDIRKRVKALIEQSLDNGGLAIGSGNSIPEYIPVENYCAMIEPVLGYC